MAYSIFGALHGIGALFALGLGVAIAVRAKDASRRHRHARLGRVYAAAMFPVLVFGFAVGIRHLP